MFFFNRTMNGVVRPLGKGAFGTVSAHGRHKASGDLRALKMLAAVLGTPSLLANSRLTSMGGIPSLGHRIAPIGPSKGLGDEGSGKEKL